MSAPNIRRLMTINTNRESPIFVPSALASLAVALTSTYFYLHLTFTYTMSTPLGLNATELEFGTRGYTSPLPTKPQHPPTLTPTQLVISPMNLTHPGGEPVNKLIYAGFLEHLGRCIYGGIVDDPKHPSDKKLLIEQEKGRLGIRKDVVEAVGAEGELGVPMLRWPGGECLPPVDVLDMSSMG